MFKHITAVLAMFAAGVCSAAIVSFNADITNNTGTANDFHVGISVSGSAQTYLQSDKFYTGASDPFTTRAATLGTSVNTIDLDWSGAVVQRDRTIHIGWEFDDGGHANSVRYNAGGTYWTLMGNRLSGTQPVLPGFTAAGIGPNSTFSLHNDTAEQLTIHNLAFQISSLQTDLNDLLPFVLPGFGSSIADITIDAGTSALFSPGLLQPGYFLLAQMTSFSSADSTNSSNIIFQHGVPVPEPSTIFLVALALGALPIFRLASRRGAAKYCGQSKQ